MAVRSRVLLPDVTVPTAGGMVDVVSRDGLMEALADAVALQDMAGGFITVAVQRVPTGAPNEMVTVGAMVEWKDRADAKTQPEPRGEPVAIPVEREPEPGPVLVPGEPDGLDPAALEDEDLSEIPAAAR